MKYCVAAQTDLVGGDIDGVEASTAQECQDVCRDVTECVAWTFVSGTPPICYRKNTGHEDMSNKAITDSGPRHCAGK